MKILIEFEDKWAVVLILVLTIVGWIVSFSLIYTTYYLSTGQDPLSWTVSWMPPWLYDVVTFIGRSGGYFSVIGSTIVGTIIAVIIWRSHKGNAEQRDSAR
jgi:mannose/fructose/N-acetylgalactosamine-specific phosphotransferase system component IIC